MDATRRPTPSVPSHGHQRVDHQPVDRGWVVAASPPGAVLAADGAAGLEWFPTVVPGTVAGAHRDDGRRLPEHLDGSDWWFRTVVDVERAAAGERLVLCLDGIATLSEVFLDGVPVASCRSMFERQQIDITERIDGRVELLICCRSLTTVPTARRRPRARWRTRIAPAELRWHRTTLLGRAPGFAPGPAPVGPWREVRIERRRGLDLHDARVRPALVGLDGVLTVELMLTWIGERRPLRLALEGPSGLHEGSFEVEPMGSGIRAVGQVLVPGVSPWFPHTHGVPQLYDLAVVVDDGDRVDLGRVGFRRVQAGPTADHDIERSGLTLHVNDIPVFARGFVWSTLDSIAWREDPDLLRRDLTLLRDSGANMVRLPGTGAYASPAFHDLCDELGILVWQDLMFANFDYPFEDDEFGAMARAEAREQIALVAGRPSLVVVCGGSEVEQQAAMFGVEIAAIRTPFFDDDVPTIMSELECDAVYVPSSPWGGALPFRFDHGVAHYFGVGGYRRPLLDVRLADVRFASECLAFGNVPEEEGMDDILAGAPGELVVTHPAWKAGVPRDVGSGWDFDDVRDHYLVDRYGVDPVALRSRDHTRYLALSRRVTGEVMQEVFCEWRRADSRCAGGLVLWWRDVVPGAGWGVLDSAGRPKAAYHMLKRLFAPVAVWTTDEGLAGILIHVANDGAEPLRGALRVSLHRAAETTIAVAERDVEVGCHSVVSYDFEQLLGRFVDAAAAYGFGPVAHDLIVTTLFDGTGGVRSQHLRFPSGPPVATRAIADVGLEVRSADELAEGIALTLSSRALALGVRVRLPGFAASDDVFDIAPGSECSVVLSPIEAGTIARRGEISADNIAGKLSFDCSRPEPNGR